MASRSAAKSLVLRLFAPPSSSSTPSVFPTMMRSFASETKTVASKKTTAPKLPPQFGIPGRYAAALYMASFKANSLDKVGKEVESLAEILRASPELKSFVTEPGMPAKRRAAGLHSVLEKMGISTGVTKRFVDVVVENKRTADLERMLEKFGDIVAQQKGHVKASVTTASPLSKSELDNVKTGLKKVLKKDETLLLEEKVDPSIISGIIIDIGDKHVDMSVQTRVKKLQQIIRNA